LNPVAVKAAVEDLIPTAAGSPREVTHSFGWATIWIQPRHLETGGFIVAAGRPHETDPLQTAQNALQRKVQHLSAAAEPQAPLVIALCDASFVRDFHASVERVLLGTATHSVFRDRNGQTHLLMQRTGQAALFTTRAAHPGLSAVVSVDKELFDEGVFLGLELWHHPEPSNPLPVGMFDSIVEHRATAAGDDEWDIAPAQQHETVLPVEFISASPRS
jgi:hypothetical protein